MADPTETGPTGGGAGAPQPGNATAAGSVDGKTPTPVGMPDFAGGVPHETTASGIGVLGDVSLQVRIELGRTKMLVEDVLKLNPDSVVELDKAAGDPVDIYVNGRRIARGEVLVLNENFCVRVSEILEPYESHS